MSDFNVTLYCEVDKETVETKVRNGIIREIRESIRSEVQQMVHDEVMDIYNKMALNQIVRDEYSKIVREDVRDLLYRIRKDEYQKFYWNGKEIEPSAEKLFNLLAAYVGYVQIMDDEDFQEAVMDKAVYEISDEIIKRFGKNKGYKNVIEALEESMKEKE